MTGEAVDPYAKQRQRMTAGRALRGVWHLVTETLRQLLRVEMVRAVIALLRYFWLAKVRGRMRVKQLDEQDAANIASNGLRSTIDHNMRVFDFSLHGFVSEVLPQFHVGRSDILIRPLSILDDVARRQHRKQVLRSCMSPRMIHGE